MLYDNEVVMLILGSGVLYFVLYNYKQIKRIYEWKWLFSAFCFIMAGWFFTVIEGFFLARAFNILEHSSYMISAIILAVWCIKVSYGRKEDRQS